MNMLPDEASPPCWKAKGDAANIKRSQLESAVSICDYCRGTNGSYAGTQPLCNWQVRSFMSLSPPGALPANLVQNPAAVGACAARTALTWHSFWPRSEGPNVEKAWLREWPPCRSRRDGCKLSAATASLGALVRLMCEEGEEVVTWQLTHSH